MNTPSHIILHLGIKKYYKNVKNIHIPRSFVIWAIAPDMGLYLCVFIYLFVQVYVFWGDMREVSRYMFNTLYFENPL